MPDHSDQTRGDRPIDAGWATLYRVGGAAAFVLLLYALGTIVQLIALGGEPKTAVEAFRLLQTNKLVGLLRLDFPTMLALPLYFLLFLGIFAALRRTDPAKTTLSTVLVFVGVTLALATPTALSMMFVGEKYAAAGTESARAQLEAVGEAILATDIWHGTGAFMGGLLLQTGAVLACAVMLRSDVFGRAIGWLGIAAHGLDLSHIALGPFLPAVGVVLMSVAGPLYLIWLPLVGRRLLQLGSGVPTPTSRRPHGVASSTPHCP